MIVKRNLRNFDYQSIWKGVKMVSEAQKRATKKYEKKTYKQILLKIRKDSNIIEWLEKQPSKNGYIINLIMEDMKKKGLSYDNRSTKKS